MYQPPYAGSTKQDAVNITLPHFVVVFFSQETEIMQNIIANKFILHI